jgi:hypothetical protein
MKALRRITSKLAKLLLVAVFLALAPAAFASSTWYVDGVNGSDNNDCTTEQTACKTIGHAISLCSAGDTIMVAPATYTENLTINLNLKIIGSGAATTIVDGGGVGTVFTIPYTKTHAVLSKLTIRNGYSAEDGGGILNLGTLRVNYSTISGNSAADYSSGGGIENDGTLTVNHSTLTANSSIRGGAIYNLGTATINNSTISNNISGGGAYGAGGGIFTGGTVTINNSTISRNIAGVGGGICLNAFAPSVTLQNSIVASNSGGNCDGGMTSKGYNLSSDGTCSFNGPGDINNTKAKLGKLGYHGGPTQTIPELPGSPAIDAGDPNGCTDSNGHLLTTDQRGYARPGKHKTDQRCDMGAFEKQTD